MVFERISLDSKAKEIESSLAFESEIERGNPRLRLQFSRKIRLGFARIDCDGCDILPLQGGFDVKRAFRFASKGDFEAFLAPIEFKIFESRHAAIVEVGDELVWVILPILPKLGEIGMGFIVAFGAVEGDAFLGEEVAGDIGPIFPFGRERASV